MKRAELNQAISNFERMDQHEKIIRLEDLKRHRYSIIYFYPKDNTPG